MRSLFLAVNLYLAVRAEECDNFDESGLIQKKTEHGKAALSRQWHLKRPPPRPVLLAAGHSSNATKNSCFEHDCDYWAASGYSCEVLQDYYQCDCAGASCPLDLPSCKLGGCNEHSCDYWSILHQMRCEDEPLSACDCTGCRCIHDEADNVPTEAPQANTSLPAEASESSTIKPEPTAAPHQDTPDACDMCGSQDCNYWVDHQLFDCETLINTYSCMCRNCVACQAPEVEEPAAEALQLENEIKEGGMDEEEEEEDRTTDPPQGCLQLCHTRTCDAWVEDGIFTCQQLKADIWQCTCEGCVHCQGDEPTPTTTPCATPTEPPVDPVVTEAPTPTAPPVTEVPTAAPEVTSPPTSPPEACKVCLALGKDCDEMRELDYSCKYIEHNWNCDCSGCECTLDEQECPQTCGSASEVTGGATPDCDFWVRQGYSCDELEKTYGCICKGCSMCES